MSSTEPDQDVTPALGAALAEIMIDPGEEPGERPSEMTRRITLLGQRVRVKLDEHVVHEGKLLGFDEGGEIQVLGDDGFVWHGWPALEVNPVTQQSREAGS